MKLIKGKYQKEKFNYFWSFSKQETHAKLNHVIENATFQDVALPHDWLIYNTKDLYEASSGWYKKTLTIETLEGAEYLLLFDAIYQDAKVYINRHLVKEWKHGYTEFIVNMTKYLVEGDNEIIVQVVYESPNSRWYSGAGIYRDVYLIVRQKDNHIKHRGIYVSTSKIKDGFDMTIDADLHVFNEAQLKHQLFYKDELVEASSNIVNKETDHQVINIVNPFLWDHNNPHLYELRSSLIVDDEVVDEYVQKVGFKDVFMDPDKGLFINGKYTKLNGVCEHHDLGAFGAVNNESMIRSRMLHLKEMGVNAIRTAHNPASKIFMELADELGFYIDNEILDVWERPKTTFDYARHFKDWINKDVESWVKRDRNHVSNLMWSIGNEIYDTHASDRGQEVTKRLKELVLKYDYNNNAQVTLASNFMPWEGAQKCADIVKCAGYNYTERLYEEHHKKHPDWIIYGSETSSTVQSRGIYHFPYDKALLVDDDKQCSSLGNSVTGWGAKSSEKCITDDRDIKYSLGTFIWTGHDYIGEPTPYDTKNAYFGQIDTAGFAKDSFYVYKASWHKDPMIHIFPYWNFAPNQMIDVRVTTNAAHFKLFLNDRLIESRDINIKHDIDIVPTFKIPFEKGELKAIAYDKEGIEVARCIRHSFDDPYELKVEINKNSLYANDKDILEVTIYAVDKNNHKVWNAKLPVEIKVSGEAKLIGLDNGDSSDFSQYKTNVKHMFSGHLKAFISSTLLPGDIDIEIKAPNLKTVNIHLESLETKLDDEALYAKSLEQITDLSLFDMNKLEDQDIPINEIQLIIDGSTKLDKSNPSQFVKAMTYPKNAAKQDLRWTIVNKHAVPSDIADIKEVEEGIMISALGDGHCILKCAVYNHKTHPDLYASISFDINGFGSLNKNPYELIAAAIYDQSTGPVGSAKEKSMFTGASGENASLTYKNIDFGHHGTNEITLSIFAFESIAHDVKLYVDGKLFDTLTYQIDTIWDVFQEQTFKLKEKLSGIKTITFEMGEKINFKGFVFKTLNRTYEQLDILSSDSYYGDSYHKTDWGMSHIGNNVSFTFNDLNFDEGCSKVMICGKSHNDKNSIKLRFTKKDGTRKDQLVDFTHTQDFDIKTFEIEPYLGRGFLDIIFLPGSDFDLKWIKFMK